MESESERTRDLGRVSKMPKMSQSISPGRGHPTELDMELALLKSIPETRPIGRNKHFLIVQLQETIRRRTGVLMDVADLWGRLEELYDLEALNDMASTSSVSIPASPEPLSPLIRRRRSRSRSTSLSSISSAAMAGTKGRESRSAKIIDSRHFASTFEIPYLRAGTGVEDSQQDADARDTHLEEEANGVWPGMIYPRAQSGVDEDPAWGDGQPAAKAHVSVTVTGAASTSVSGGAGHTKRGKRGKGQDKAEEKESARASSSSLSDDEDKKTRRGSGARAKKRKRDSGTTVDASEGDAETAASAAAPKTERRRRKR